MLLQTFGRDGVRSVIGCFLCSKTKQNDTVTYHNGAVKCIHILYASNLRVYKYMTHQDSEQ